MHFETTWAKTVLRASTEMTTPVIKAFEILSDAGYDLGEILGYFNGNVQTINIHDAASSYNMEDRDDTK